MRPRISLAEGLKAHLAARGGSGVRTSELPQSFETLEKPRRLKIWDVRDNVQCSVVGTCLSHGDLLGIVARCGLTLAADMTDYALHGFFTSTISKDNAVSRAVQKLLDRRHEGILRRFARARSAQELTGLWAAEFSAGRIPGAYWAVLTFAHSPSELQTRAFGEVHMLSHVLGRTTHAGATRASELEARVGDLEARLARMAERHAQSLLARDRQIAALSGELTLSTMVSRLQTPEPSPATGRRGRAPSGSKRGSKRDSQRERALVTARARARSAEADVKRLTLELDAARRDRPEKASPNVLAADNCPGARACQLNLPAGDRLKVLYLGGRNGAIEQLRAVAEHAGIELFHHDGGIEHTPQRIDELVHRCHVVFCPVTCVSHQACLRAKRTCQRLQRQFVPLRSAGATTFARAISDMEIVERSGEQ